MISFNLRKWLKWVWFMLRIQLIHTPFIMFGVIQTSEGRQTGKFHNNIACGKTGLPQGKTSLLICPTPSLTRNYLSSILQSLLKLIFFGPFDNIFNTMKIVAGRPHHQSDSQESYGHQFRLKYRRECSGWGGEERSRRISQQKKERLITMVTKENYRIKEAGRMLGISYSTAKKIFTNFRMELRAKKDSDTGDDEKHVACMVQEVPEHQMHLIPQIQLISSIAGQMQASSPDKKLFNKP